MTVEYDPAEGIIQVALRLKSTAVANVFYKPEFYLLMFFHLATSWGHKLEYYNPSKYNLELTMTLTGISGSLMTFFAVFYNGNVFERYNRLYVITKNMNELCLHAASIISREIHGKPLQRKMVRMLLASAFMFFFERTEHESNANISEEEYDQMVKLDLITQQEELALREHCKKLGKNAAMPSYMLLHWSIKLYRAKGNRLNELEKTFWAIRRSQDDVVEIMELPMPFQYFHIMNLMLMLNLALWSYALALNDSLFGSVIFFFVQLVFQGLRELSIAMADPYGTDDADFPLDQWMSQLYMRVNKIIEDGYDKRRAASTLGDVGPLVQLQAGQTIVQLGVEGSKGEFSEEDPSSSCEFKEDPRKRDSVGAMTHSDEEEDDEDDDDDD